MVADRFTPTDALILQAIIQNDMNEGASLSGIISFADYINHAVLTYEEFNTGISRLTAAGLIESINKHYLATSLLKTWRLKFKKLSIHKEYLEIVKYLSTLKIVSPGNAEIMREEFDECVKNYLSR